MSDHDPQFLDVGDPLPGQKDSSRRIAVMHRPETLPGRPQLFWLSGFKSDMMGSKAVALDGFACEQGLACTRFDYTGHGQSGGTFEDACVSDWLEDAVAVFDRHCNGPTVIVGSSMGGWLALLLALSRQQADIVGLVLIAPAVDFTEELMWKQRFTDEIRETILREGRWAQPSAYGDDPYVITARLIEDGRKHLLLGKEIVTGCPVRILQGAKDPDVPWQHAMRLVQALPAADVTFSLVPDGDHRLSRPQDLELLQRAVMEML
ncbi:alpha/beta hydrolase [Roseibium limicola]|uniref:Alpha/beta fold hydrolase n=1 Tax=Roseibium limicola TaxID=2816037 RepID=A0A939ER11_9HYPH|nr:alpha/beta fold hydrolase [Roseibium limicola]MBO0346755.1 alpha/beta fold hydrolase [Roseibium limicola]